MPIGREEVERIAKLARLSIDDEEATTLAAELERIVGHIDRLAEVELPADADALTYFDSDVHREDRCGECLTRDAALANAPETDGAHFLVPKIVEKGAE